MGILQTAIQRFNNLRGRIMAGISAFNENMVVVDFESPTDFTDVSARRMRYSIYWAMYENTAYRNIHAWGQTYRLKYGLYKYIRNVYNPSFRLGEFWSTHLMGGMLDPLAGDGKTTPSCLPILVPEDNAKAEALRFAIATLWRDSNWQINKDIFTLWGSVMGDAFLMVKEDANRGKVKIEVVHPGDITDMSCDEQGNIRAYTLERASMDEHGKACMYKETGENMGGGEIMYRTYRDDKPHAWGEDGAEWVQDYGFIPMVAAQHQNVGLPWGWSVIHPVRSKMHEADDVASSISDHIRKNVNAPFLLAGVNPPTGTTTAVSTGSAATTKRPEVGREETPYLYAGAAEAHATPLIATLDYAGAYQHLTGILQEIEREFPELRFDNMRLMGDASGRALRLARQPAEAKVRMRRAGYDDALKRAQQMAISIGGMRGYDGYKDFNDASYKAGELEHTIGDRPVFATDELEAMEEETLFWQNAAAAQSAGVSIEGYLRDKGWDDERIQNVLYSGVPEQ